MLMPLLRGRPEPMGRVIGQLAGFSPGGDTAGPAVLTVCPPAAAERLALHVAARTPVGREARDRERLRRLHTPESMRADQARARAAGLKSGLGPTAAAKFIGMNGGYMSQLVNGKAGLSEAAERAIVRLERRGARRAASGASGEGVAT